MEKQLRHDRERKAADLLRSLAASTDLRRPRHATAFALGAAAVQGEPRAEQMSGRAKAAVGWSLGFELVRRRIASVTPFNAFTLLPVSS
jgi:hypothetical protein